MDKGSSVVIVANFDQLINYNIEDLKSKKFGISKYPNKFNLKKYNL